MKKKVIFTIDVEGHIGTDPVDKLIYGKIDGKSYGIELIMDICDQYDIRALFFVDVAEAFHYGEKKIADVISTIRKRGHDVGVHIHPDHMCDKNNLFLSKYSINEQEKIIEKCTAFFESVTGEKPKAFRAGKYSASRNTLEILSKYEYKVDFSEFYGQKWCGIDPPICGTKSVRLDSGLIEIPTMSYNNSVPFLFNRYDKIDINMPFGEYKMVMKKLEKDMYTDPIVLFAHSFSFIKWRKHPNKPKPNYNEIEKFNKMIEYVKNTDMEFISLNELLEKKYDEVSCVEESIHTPKITGIPALWYMILRVLKVLKMKWDIRYQDV